MQQHLRYDASGNILCKSDVPGLSDCQGGDTYQYGANGAGLHAVTQVDLPNEHTRTFDYDQNGHMTEDRVNGSIERRFDYTPFNKVRRVAQKYIEVDQVYQQAEFHYGPNRGRFLQREVRGGGMHPLEVLSRTHYIGNVEIEFAGANFNQPKVRRDIGGVALEITEPSGHRDTRYQHKDHLGSIVALSTAEGVLHARMGFDPWGQRRDPEQVQVPWLQWVAPGSLPFHVFAPPHWALDMLRETPRGYTGHEHLDAYGIIHMNGRIYDPHLGRFLQADPFMEDTGTLNRYTYVLNNPMMYTDPSGYFTDNPLRFMVAFIATAATAGTAGPFFAGLAHAGTISATTATALTFATVGFVSGGIATGSLEGAFTGAVAGVLTGGIPSAGWNFGAQLLGRALIGGTVSHVQGGKFGHGFLAAGASFAASPAISNITSDVGAQMLGEMIVGGTISEATGGSFANGAIASAMAFATGKVLSQSDDLPTNEEIMQMSDAELDAWIASRANLEFDPSTAIAWQSTARVSRIGFGFALSQSTAAGENAAMYWAERHVETGNPLYAVPGVAASLWTPDTYVGTILTLGGGVAAGRAVGPISSYLGPGGPVIGHPSYGGKTISILRSGKFRFGWGRHGGPTLRVGVKQKHYDLIKRPPPKQ